MGQAQGVVPYFLCRRALPVRAFLCWHLGKEATGKADDPLCEFQKSRVFPCPFHKGLGELLRFLLSLPIAVPGFTETCSQPCGLEQNLHQLFKAQYLHGQRFGLQEWYVLPCQSAIRTFVNSEGDESYEAENIGRILSTLETVEWWRLLREDFEAFYGRVLEPLALPCQPEVQNIQDLLTEFEKYVNYMRKQPTSKISSNQIRRIRNRSKGALDTIEKIEAVFEGLARQLETTNISGR